MLLCKKKERSALEQLPYVRGHASEKRVRKRDSRSSLRNVECNTMSYKVNFSSACRSVFSLFLQTRARRRLKHFCLGFFLSFFRSSLQFKPHLIEFSTRLQHLRLTIPRERATDVKYCVAKRKHEHRAKPLRRPRHIWAAAECGSLIGREATPPASQSARQALLLLKRCCWLRYALAVRLKSFTSNSSLIQTLPK